jgi:hypothetical protein
MLKPPAGAAELLAQIEQSKADVSRLTTLATRRAMNPEEHRIALEAARDGERTVMELLSKKYGCKATFCELVLSMNECAQTDPDHSRRNL